MQVAASQIRQQHAIAAAKQAVMNQLSKQPQNQRVKNKTEISLDKEINLNVSNLEYATQKLLKFNQEIEMLPKRAYQESVGSSNDDRREF